MAAAMDDDDSAHDYKCPFVVQAPVAAASPSASRELDPNAAAC
jgi:hypothetical protein